jgi:4-hydroxyphenylpyruvate dioxygenase
MLEEPLPGHGEPVPSCRRAASCWTAAPSNGKPRLLLQIFSETMLGPVFFEFIQRKGDDGFGEGNFIAGARACAGLERLLYSLTVRQTQITLCVT